MKPQTKLGSLAESAQNIGVGYAISGAATYLIGPLFHMHPGVGDVLGFGGAMTVISIARSYGIRRWNEYRRGRDTPPHFQHIMEDIAAERVRQITHEGFTPGHDDEHAGHELAAGAAAYAYAASLEGRERTFFRRLNGSTPLSVDRCFRVWPWADAQFKPTHRRRDLVKAAAMIVAEIGRLDRLKPR